MDSLFCGKANGGCKCPQDTCQEPPFESVIRNAIPKKKDHPLVVFLFCVRTLILKCCDPRGSFFGLRGVVFRPRGGQNLDRGGYFILSIWSTRKMVRYVKGDVCYKKAIVKFAYIKMRTHYAPSFFTEFRRIYGVVFRTLLHGEATLTSYMVAFSGFAI